jgi:hypothetical protein
MNNKKLLSYVAVAVLLLTACKKEGDTIINNYGSSSDGPGVPKRTLLKAYGYTDSSQVIRFTYQNGEIGKLKEFTSFSSGVATAKMIILYNGSNQPEGYQSYTLPANTLNEQGTYKLDAEGRIIQVVKRKTNGDTIGIAYFQYNTVDYQPISYYFYDKTADRNTIYDYFTYDKNGNVVKAVSYEKNSTDPLYKVSETEASGFGKGINGLNQLYYYLVSSASSYGYRASSTLYFSNYLPTSTRTQNYNPDGTSSSVDISNLEFSLDNNNNVVRLGLSGTSQTIFMQY